MGIILENTFTAEIEHCGMEGGWHIVPVPKELSEPYRPLAINFGFIPIVAKVGNSSWQTSLLPSGDGTHFIALPAKVRKAENLSLGSTVSLSFEPRV